MTVNVYIYKYVSLTYIPSKESSNQINTDLWNLSRNVNIKSVLSTQYITTYYVICRKTVLGVK